ncbi:MAG: DUF2065 domain-containing protein [Pseudomonadota bacterium]|nr:DUF2065 domain-containing protein [Pseudomonadota bacterium]
MPESLLAAFALVFVVEGFLPLVAPRLWRDTFTRMLGLSDGQLRFVGLAAVMVGLMAYTIISQ